MYSKNTLGQRQTQLDRYGFLEPVNISGDSALYPNVFGSTLPTQAQAANYDTGTLYRDNNFFGVVRVSPYSAIPAIPASIRRVITATLGQLPQNNTTTFSVASQFIWEGTTIYGGSPTMFDALIGQAGINTATIEVQVFDQTNGLIIAGPASSLNTSTILSLPYNSNASATPAIYALQFRRVGGPVQFVSCSALSIAF